MQIDELMERVVFLSTDTTGFNADDELLRVTLVDSEGGIIYNQLITPKQNHMGIGSACSWHFTGRC